MCGRDLRRGAFCLTLGAKTFILGKTEGTGEGAQMEKGSFIYIGARAKAKRRRPWGLPCALWAGACRW